MIMNLQIHTNQLKNREWYHLTHINKQKIKNIYHETKLYLQQLHAGNCLQLGTLNTVVRLKSGL